MVPDRAALVPYEIAVVGAGPAGSALAMELAAGGRRVLLIEQRDRAAAPDPLDYRIGEGVPGAIRLLLSKLGVWSSFLEEGHLPCHGNGSYWGSDRFQTTDFIRDPHGHGWHLDRPAFDEGLRRAAEAKGARLWRPAKVLGFQRFDGGWRLTVRRPVGQPETVEAGFVVDASGRVGRLARELGAERRQEDELIAFHALFVPSDEGPEDRSSLTFIEAAPDGWWYSALLPRKRRMVVFFTDAEDEARRTAGTSKGFDDLLSAAGHLSDLLTQHGYVRATEPAASSASSGRLGAAVGDRWLAVGDAASSFDPLSSQGIYTALHHGIVGAEAVERCLGGEANALEGYAHRVTAVYEAFLSHRRTFYAMERRWSDRPFWRRRQAPG